MILILFSKTFKMILPIIAHRHRKQMYFIYYNTFHTCMQLHYLQYGSVSQFSTLRLSKVSHLLVSSKNLHEYSKLR